MCENKSNKLAENLEIEIKGLEEVVDRMKGIVYGIEKERGGLDVQKDKDKGCNTRIVIESRHFIIEDTGDSKEAVVKAKYIDRISGRLDMHRSATLQEKINYCEGILDIIENHLETVNSRLEGEKEQ
nr:hypothetical protein [uncultured Anaerosporobacter sp.]